MHAATPHHATVTPQHNHDQPATDPCMPPSPSTPRTIQSHSLNCTHAHTHTHTQARMWLHSDRRRRRRHRHRSSSSPRHATHPGKSTGRSSSRRSPRRTLHTQPVDLHLAERPPTPPRNHTHTRTERKREREKERQRNTNTQTNHCTQTVPRLASRCPVHTLHTHTNRNTPIVLHTLPIQSNPIQSNAMQCNRTHLCKSSHQPPSNRSRPGTLITINRQASPTMMTAATHTRTHTRTSARRLPHDLRVGARCTHCTRDTTTIARVCIHTAAPQQAQPRLVHVDALELAEYVPTGQAARKRISITSQPASQPAAAHAREQALDDEAKYPTPHAEADADGAAVGAADEHAAAPLLDESPAAHSVAQHTHQHETSKPTTQPASCNPSRTRAAGLSVCLSATHVCKTIARRWPRSSRRCTLPHHTTPPSRHNTTTTSLPLTRACHRAHRRRERSSRTA